MAVDWDKIEKRVKEVLTRKGICIGVRAEDVLAMCEEYKALCNTIDRTVTKGERNMNYKDAAQEIRQLCNDNKIEEVAKYIESIVKEAKQSCDINKETLIAVLKTEAEGLLDGPPGDNPEYERGMCELIARTMQGLGMGGGQGTSPIARKIGIEIGANWL